MVLCGGQNIFAAYKMSVSNALSHMDSTTHDFKHWCVRSPCFILFCNFTEPHSYSFIYECALNSRSHSTIVTRSLIMVAIISN